MGNTGPASTLAGMLIRVSASGDDQAEAAHPVPVPRRRLSGGGLHHRLQRVQIQGLSVIGDLGSAVRTGDGADVSGLEAIGEAGVAFSEQRRPGDGAFPFAGMAEGG